jgi:hypothetical protein
VTPPRAQEVRRRDRGGWSRPRSASCLSRARARTRNGRCGGLPPTPVSVLVGSGPGSRVGAAKSAGLVRARTREAGYYPPVSAPVTPDEAFCNAEYAQTTDPLTARRRDHEPLRAVSDRARRAVARNDDRKHHLGRLAEIAKGVELIDAEGAQPISPSGVPHDTLNPIHCVRAVVPQRALYMRAARGVVVRAWLSAQVDAASSSSARARWRVAPTFVKKPSAGTKWSCASWTCPERTSSSATRSRV